MPWDIHSYDSIDLLLLCGAKRVLVVYVWCAGLLSWYRKTFFNYCTEIKILFYSVWWDVGDFSFRYSFRAGNVCKGLHRGDLTITHARAILIMWLSIETLGNVSMKQWDNACTVQLVSCKWSSYVLFYYTLQIRIMYIRFPCLTIINVH